MYDRHLREFLFREGFNMPYSQQRSPSGQPDVTSNLESDDVLVCELKVYDSANRDVGHLATGVTQALQYTTDYQKHAAYLVIINLTELTARATERMARDGQAAMIPRRAQCPRVSHPRARPAARIGEQARKVRAPDHRPSEAGR